ncbi:MAG TPA: hypothetical protein DCE23_08530 [Firmicutes bacterium]|nr:hypothetical protein [Bacillota bacterium]
MKEPILYRIVRPIISFLFKFLFRPTYIGLEYLSDSEPLVLGGNHTNNFDCLLLIASTNRVIHFLAKDSLIKGIKAPIFKGMGIIPVNRQIHDKQALNSAIESLKEGKVIGIFPESTINRTPDTIMPFKIGCVKMAHDTNAKIVPFTITGKYKLFKKSIRLEFYEPYFVNSDDLTKENEKLMNIIKSNLEEKRK